MGPEIVLGIGVSYLLISSILNNIPTKYSVKKIKKCGILREPIKLDNVSQLSINEYLKFDENNGIVNDFFETIVSNLEHCDLSAFYTNLEKLKISSNNDSFLLKLLDALCGTRTGGAYLSKYNKILLAEQEFGKSYLKRSILNHELLHLASSRRDANFSYSGFHFTSKKTSVGEGINEGYTELLNGRYFSSPRNSDSYFDLQVIAAGIESIIGQSKMEQMYFSNDLNGLISELEKYVSKDEAITLIVKCDTLLKRKVRTDDKRTRMLADSIRKDIALIKLKKIEKDKELGIISERDFINEVYSLELFVNGYTTFRKTDENGKEESRLVSSGPLLGFEFIEMSIDDFNKYADCFYADFLGHGLYDANDWKNKFGISTKKIIETKFLSKSREKINSLRRKLGLSCQAETSVIKPREFKPNKAK